SLKHFPAVSSAPDATPFVSIYSPKGLRGCMGNARGAPGERVVRAFLQALHDPRFGEIEPNAELAAQVSYVTRARVVSRQDVLRVFEAGTHGMALTRAADPPVLLLPDVARDRRFDAESMFAALLRKAKREALAENDAVWLFETERASSRSFGVKDTNA